MEKDYKKIIVFRKFRNINMNLTTVKPLLLDSIISPSAVNLEFYNKVAILSPFGSGNPEPKFIIENVKIIAICYLCVCKALFS